MHVEHCSGSRERMKGRCLRSHVENWRKIDNVSVMNDSASSPADPVKERGECCWSKSLMALTNGSRWGPTDETNKFVTQSTFSIRAVTVTRREQVWASFHCFDRCDTDSNRPHLQRTRKETCSVDTSIVSHPVHFLLSDVYMLNDYLSYYFWNLTFGEFSFAV